MSSSQDSSAMFRQPFNDNNQEPFSSSDAEPSESQQLRPKTNDEQHHHRHHLHLPHRPRPRLPNAYPEPKKVDRSHRRLTVYQSRPGRPRWVLHMQAVFWRVLMGLGMFFHRLAPPRPPKPNFTRTIPSTLNTRQGNFVLHFYVPRDYETQRRLWIDRPDVSEGAAESSVVAPASNDSEDPRILQGLQKRLSVVSTVGQSIRRRSMSSRKWGGYPVIVNFHGGGFTLGSAEDDARWCGTVVDECNAVVVSVDYRLAPECPFPTAVEDGVDAVLYLYAHAEELGLDREKIALSGFSSGANMAFTVPLRLHDEIAGFPRDDTSMYRTMSRQPTGYGSTTALVGSSSASGALPKPASSGGESSTSTTSTAVNTKDTNVHIVDPDDDSAPQVGHALPSETINTETDQIKPSRNNNNKHTQDRQTPSGKNNDNDPNQSSTGTSGTGDFHKGTTYTSTTEIPTGDREGLMATANPRNLPTVPIRCIIPWYPPVDYTRSREARRATLINKTHDLPAVFTDLFDESYLHPPHTIALDSPYLSPGVAPTSLLRDGLPSEIIMTTCEWDMLMDEGQAFRDRLTSPEIGKRVIYHMVPSVPHGWDKAPNPWKPTPGVREQYLRACREIKRIMALPVREETPSAAVGFADGGCGGEVEGQTADCQQQQQQQQQHRQSVTFDR